MPNPTLAAEFDHEWNIVLDRVKQSQDLTDLHELLAGCVALFRHQRAGYRRPLNK